MAPNWSINGIASPRKSSFHSHSCRSLGLPHHCMCDCMGGALLATTTRHGYLLFKCPQTGSFRELRDGASKAASLTARLYQGGTISGPLTIAAMVHLGGDC